MEALQEQIAAADALLERARQDSQAQSELIDLADVVEDEQFRSLRADLGDIDELAAKLAERGQLVPILVWLQRGQYVLLSGHRRVAALRRLGATVVKAIVYDDRALSPRDALDIAIDDNVDRDSFTRSEMARLVARLVGEGMTQRKIARRLRLSTGTVSDYFRLDKAPPDIRAAVDDGRLAVRAGLLLAEKPDPVRAEVLARAAPGMLSLGDVRRALAATGPRPDTRRARRGAAWSRPSTVVDGLAWQRQRDGERELRLRLPDAPTPEQRLALRKLLLDHIRRL